MQYGLFKNHFNCATNRISIPNVQLHDVMNQQNDGGCLEVSNSPPIYYVVDMIQTSFSDVV
jgi:hypothetical protein